MTPSTAACCASRPAWPTTGRCGSRRSAAATPRQEFNALFADTNFPCKEGAFRGDTRNLQDHMMHHVLRLADRRGLALQVHTGLQEGNGNYIYHSDPSLLTNLFMEYSNVRFDCFHIGYPYQQVLAALAKNFRNVFIDFAWAHIISPTAAVNALVEYLDSVPANKISGFGGDYCCSTASTATSTSPGENIARALAIKIEQGAFDVDYAQAGRPDDPARQPGGDLPACRIASPTPTAGRSTTASQAARSAKGMLSRRCPQRICGNSRRRKSMSRCVTLL